MHASWIKSGHQPPHLLRVRTDGPLGPIMILGIDRFTRLPVPRSGASYTWFIISFTHTRVFFAYSCQREDIQTLDLSLPDNAELQDAQSGMIKGLRKSATGSLLVDLTDVGEIEFSCHAYRPGQASVVN